MTPEQKAKRVHHLVNSGNVALRGAMRKAGDLSAELSVPQTRRDAIEQKRQAAFDALDSWCQEMHGAYSDIGMTPQAGDDKEIEDASGGNP